MSNASDHWPLYNRNQPQYYIWNGNIRGGRFFIGICLEFCAFIKFNILGLLHIPPNQQFSNRKAQEPGKDREPLLVPFGMSSCQCSERRIEQVVIVNNMMIMGLCSSLLCLNFKLSNLENDYDITSQPLQWPFVVNGARRWSRPRQLELLGDLADHVDGHAIISVTL